MNPSFSFMILHFSRLFIFVLLGYASWAYSLPEDKNQTMRIVADSQSVSLKDGVVIYSGDVKLVQGTLEITGDKITVHRNKDQTEEYFIAEGKPARYRQQPEANKAMIHAEAEIINYNLKTEQLTLEKNVSIEQDGAVTKSGHADYDVKSQTAKFSTGRVETVIPPKPEKKD